MSRPAANENGQKDRDQQQAPQTTSYTKHTVAIHYRAAFPFVTVVSLLHVLALFSIPVCVAMDRDAGFDIAISILTSQSAILSIWLFWGSQVHIWVRLLLLASYPWMASGVMYGYHWQLWVDERWVLAIAAISPALLGCGTCFISGIQLANPGEAARANSNQFGIKHLFGLSAFIAVWLAFVRWNSVLEISEYLAIVEYHALLILGLSCVTTLLCWATLTNFRVALPLAVVCLIAIGAIIAFADETLEAITRIHASNCYWINLAIAFVTFLPFRWEGYRLMRTSRPD